MTSGTIFQLYVNDGSISSILYGNKVLNKSLKNARNTKIQSLIRKEEKRFLEAIDEHLKSVNWSSIGFWNICLGKLQNNRRNSKP